MRYFTIILMLVLASCASPKSSPHSYYSDVYVPGGVHLDQLGHYETKAAVFAANDRPIARKAAFARLYLKAKEGGFGYFDIADEHMENAFGYKFSAKGRLYENAAIDADVYPIDAIKRMLKGLPVRTLKEIAESERRRRATVAKKKAQAAQKSVAEQKAAKSLAESKAKKIKKSKPVPLAKNRPIAEEKPVTDDEPIVILAPTDITGSIKKSGRLKRSSVKMKKRLKTGGGHRWHDLNSLRPKNLRNIPSGVVLGGG